MTTNKPSDLIAIANSELAEKLNKQATQAKKEQQEQQQKEQEQEQQPAASTPEAPHQSFRKDTWKAVFTLNLLRYGFAVFLLVSMALSTFYPGLQVFDDVIHLDLFLAAAITLLISAITFTYLTYVRKFALSEVLVTQFCTDAIIISLLVHATGSIGSSFTILFFIMVTTSSVVLRRKHAIALASGTLILMFYEHIYSVWQSGSLIQPRYGLLASYGMFTMSAGVFISHLAKRLRHAELKSFIPGNETIEEFLIREEINALKSALASTDGNKTEAAKLLGMTFRSFRYKLTKYDID